MTSHTSIPSVTLLGKVKLCKSLREHEIMVAVGPQELLVFISYQGNSCGFLIPDDSHESFTHVLRFSKQSFNIPIRYASVKCIGNPDLMEKWGNFLRPYQKNIDTQKHVSLTTNVKLGPNDRIRIEKAAEKKDLLSRKIRVLVVDDSRTMQLVLAKMISMDARFEMAGTVTDPTQVSQAIETQRPDVITLDMNMEPLNGVEVLRQVGPRFKVPTVVVSALTLEEGSLVLQALEVGAVDYFPKPAQLDLEADGPALCDKLFMAAQSRVHIATAQPRQLKSAQLLPQGMGLTPLSDNAVILLGSSTGGTEALREVLTQFPAPCPPVLVVQHIPPVFSKALAQRLNSLCPDLTIIEAQGGERLQKSCVYIAPGDKHLTIENSGGSLKTKLLDTEKVSGHKPSVDVLFHSAVTLPYKIVAALLTGMGRDGAEGLKALRQKGARTIAQSEKTCVVYGMPRAAVENGGAECTEDLDKIPQKIFFMLQQKKESAA